MATDSKKLISFLRAQFQSEHMMLEGTMADVTSEQLAWKPQGKAIPLGANYGHILISEDATFNGMLKGAAPLAATSWAGRTGLSALPPAPFQWAQWAQDVSIDLPALRQFAQAVYTSTDQYLESLSDDDLSLPLDLSALGVGQQTLGWMISTMLGNVAHHLGEISCLKGLQGAKGYPM